MNHADTLLDLTKAQVCAVLEQVAGAPVIGFTAHMPNETAGGNGHATWRVAFTYRAISGEDHEVTLFVKRCVWEGRPEGIHYRHLKTMGVPTARLFGAAMESNGTEVIFLEPLTAIGYQKDSEYEWRSMLSLLARFNTCPITPTYLPHLHEYSQVGQMDTGFWVTGFDPRPTEEHLEEGWELSGVPIQERSALTFAAHALFDRVAAQPTGLLHQDFTPDNFGWRGDRAEMVVFDLPKNARGPRFADVAPYLSVPHWFSQATFLDSTDSNGESYRDMLTRHYLDEYARFGGPGGALEVFRAEVADLFWAHKVTLLPWLAEQGHLERVRMVLDYLGTYP